MSAVRIGGHKTRATADGANGRTKLCKRQFRISQHKNDVGIFGVSQTDP